MNEKFSQILKVTRSWVLCLFCMIALVGISTNTYSQTLVSPTGDGGFETGGTLSANGWTGVNSVQSFFVGAPTPASAGTNCAYTSTTSGSWTPGTALSIAHIYRDINFPAGTASILTVRLKYKTLAVDGTYDYIKVHLVPTSTTPVAGTALTTGQLGSNTDGTTSYALYTFNGSVTPGTTQRLVISFRQDGFSPYGAAAIDEVEVIVSSPSTYTATANGGLWSNAATWVGGVVPPAGNDVLIPAGSIVTADQNLSYNNLTINGTLQYNATTTTTTTLAGDLIIGSTGRYLPYTTAAAAVGNVTVGGNFTNNGFANLSLATIIMNAASGSKSFDGTGTFTVDQNGKGLIRALLFTSLGSLTINTTQNLTVQSALGNINSFNPNGKLSIDNTAVVYGQAFNTQVASVAVTAMGSLYGASAPVTTATGATRWIASTAVAVGNIRFTASNIYVCTVAGTTSVTAPSHTSGTATDGGATWLWVGAGGTVGNAFVPSTTPTAGTVYFYGNNLYLCTVAGLPSAAAPPTCTSGTCVSGAATYRYIGTPARFSVNYDATTATVRSLNIVNAGAGYPAAPTVTIVSSTATGSGAAATATVFQQSGITTAFLNQISTGASYSSAFSSINNSQGVGAITVASGGTNYTVAPQVGIGFPTSQNLVTAGGSGYTSAPTVTVSGGTFVTGKVDPTFTVTVNQGKVVSVYCSTGGSGYLTPPTLTLTGGGGSGATCAFVAGSHATATPVIGSNGQILSFTITNPGSGYVAAPTCLLAGGTFTTAATAAPIARIGLYNLSYGWFTPSPAAGTTTAGNEIPTDRKVNTITFNNTRINFTGNLILTGTAPTTWTSGLVDMGGNTLTYTWNGYAGALPVGTAFGVKNGSITLTGRGGGTTGSTWSFPFVGNSFQAFTGTGSDGSNGSDITTMTVTETAAPSGGTAGFQPFGSRAWRVRTTAGTTYGTNATASLRWNSNDSIDGTAFPTLSNQSDLFIGEASSLSGPYTLRTDAYGSGGLIPVLATFTTSTSTPGPIANTTDKYYAYINTQVVPTITSFTPTNVCAGAGIVTITGTGFRNITTSSVSIGGTAPTFIVSFTSTQIVCRVGSGTTGLITVTTPGGVATSATPITVTSLSGLVNPTRSPSTGLICTAGGSVTIDATQTGAISYDWTPTTGLSAPTSAITAASPSVTTQYQVNIDMGVCTASYISSAGVIPAFSFTPTSSIDSICFATPSIAVNMNANLSSSGFSVASIPYSPATPPSSGVTTLASGGVLVVPTTGGTGFPVTASEDDGGWGGIPIGFNYNFFGTVFNQLAVGTNGLVMFGTVPGYTTTAGELGQYIFNGPPYFPNATNPANIIALMAGDMRFNWSNSSLRYWTDGIAPTRRFVLSGTYSAYSGGAPTTVQLFLYESTGVVEVHIASSSSTATRLIGLQDASRTIGAVAPGWQNRTTTLTTPEAWRFIPPAAYTFNWSAPSGVALSSSTIVNPVATVSSAPVSNYNNYALSVTATNPITGCTATQVDSFKVFNTPTAPTANNYIECSSPTVAHASVTSTASAFSTHTYKWYSAATGGVLLQSGPHDTYDSLITQSTTFYVSEVNGNCESPRVAVFDSVPALTVSSSPLAICAVGGSVTLTATPTIGGTFSWSGGPFTTLSSTSISANPTTTTSYTVTETIGSCSISKVVSVGVYDATVFTPTSSVDSICYVSPSVTVNMNANLSGTTFAITPMTFGLYPTPGSGVTTLCNAGTALVPQATVSLDDGGWRNINMGFNFNYLGFITDSVNIGTNGTIMFGTYNGNSGFTAPYGLADFSFGTLPSTGEPFNMIAGCAVDLYLSTSGSIKYWTQGIAPNRKFIISYENVPGFTTNGTHTFQIVLNETIGTAEVHIATGTSTNNKLVGCNNFDGTVGSLAPGYGKTGPITNEAYLFTPPASYTFAWTGTGLSSSTVVNPNAVISTSPTGAYDNYVYSVAATNTTTGCTTTRSDSFKVFQTPAAPTTTPGTRCGVGTVVLSASSPLGTAQWYDVPTGGTVLATTSSYTASITATDTFYVAYKNGTCEGPRSMVIATVTPPPALVMGATDTTCLGSPVNLSVSSPTEPTYTYAWSPGTLTGASPSVNPTSTTTYTVTATSASGCVNVGTQVVVVNPVPSTVTISTNPLPVCFGIGSDTLIASGGTVGSTAVITTTGTSPTTSTGTESFFYRTWEGAKHQYLISASELTAMGYSAGNLNSLSVNNTTTIPVNSNFDNLSINIGHTTATALTTTFLPTPGTTVYGPANYNVVLGANTFTFSTPFTWDGTQNILIEVCFDNDPTGSCTSGTPICWGNTFAVDAATTSFTSCNYQYSDNTAGTPRTFCSSPTGTTGTSSLRPIFTFDYSSSVPTNITWSPVTDLYVDAAGTTPYTTGLVTNTVYSRATTSRAYFATATVPSTGCFTNSTSTTVLVNAPGTGGCPVAPRNDNICTPLTLNTTLTTSLPYSVAGYANINTHTDTTYQSNTYATRNVGEPLGSCGASGLNNKTMWYKFTAPFCATPQVHISTDDRSSTDFNTRVSVYRRAAPYSCTSAFTEVACSDDATYYLNTGSTTNSTVVLTPNSASPAYGEYAPGEDLYIQTSGYSAASGNYGLIIDAEPYIPVVGAVGSGTAVIDWSTSMTSPWGGILGTYIQWRPVGAGSTVAGTYAYIPGPSSTYTITGLLPGTAYEFWASYTCGNGGRWWSKKGTFTTSSSCVGSSPSIVSITLGTPCTQPVVNFNATSLAYSSYRVVRRQTGSSTVIMSPVYYTSPATQSYISAPLALGRTYQFYVVAYCGTAKVDSSAISTYTVCTSLRTANPNATEQVDEDKDKDVAYIMPNGTVVYGLPFNAMDLPFDANNPNEQTITLETMDASTYFGRDNTPTVAEATEGEMTIYPNPANTEATLSYTLEHESDVMNIQVLDAQGKVMITDQIANPTMSGSYTINLNKYSAGVYFVKVQAGDYVQTKKLMVETR